MCLATVAKVIKVDRKDETAWVDFGGVRRQISIDILPDVKVGDYVLVHTGFAIEKVDEERAKEMLKAWKEVFEAEEGMIEGTYYPGD